VVSFVLAMQRRSEDTHTDLPSECHKFFEKQSVSLFLKIFFVVAKRVRHRRVSRAKKGKGFRLSPALTPKDPCPSLALFPFCASPLFGGSQMISAGHPFSSHFPAFWKPAGVAVTLF